MGITKTELHFFDIMQYEEEGEYLRKMHQHGWEFIHVSLPGIYHFRECEPEDVVYQLDYNQEGRAHKAEYVEMFQDCGWEYLQDAGGYSYFRKPVSAMQFGEERIFCDDASRMEMLERVLRGRLCPLLLMFCGLILQLVGQWGLNGFTSPITIMLFGMIILYLSIFMRFFTKYRNYRKWMNL